MEKEQFSQLVDKVSNGIASQDEMNTYNVYMNRLVPSGSSWEKKSMGDQDRIKIELWNSLGLPFEKINPKKASLWLRIAVAASLLMIIGLGMYFYGKGPIAPSIDAKIAGSRDIVPGRNGATLTLANGQTIVLNDALVGKIAAQSGVNIIKTPNGQITYENSSDVKANESMFNVLTTAFGEQSRMRLPDGTVVFLNAGSSIRYPVVFSGNERRVIINGEVYFEVSHNPEKPFIVVSKNQVVTVLGTHFNINSYDDEDQVRTTLVEGLVNVSIDGRQKKTLRVGQQLTVSGNEISISNVEVDEAVAWKDGYFEFSNSDIRAVMRQLARWYNVEVSFEGTITPETFTARISRNKNIGQVLKIVRASGSTNVEIKGRRIVIKN